MPASPAKNIHWSKFTCDMRDGARLHFLPHEDNDYVPHVLKHRVLASYSVIGILLKALLIAAPTVLPAAAVYSSSLTAGNVIKLTNVARADAGRSALREDSRLTSAALAKADDIISKQYFAHTSPEGKKPWDWIRAAGYDYRHAGENLAIHFFTAEGVHDGWMASPTHKQNIVDARYADIGVGVEQGKYEGYDTVVVVQMFGVLKSETVAGTTTAPTSAPAHADAAPASAPAAAPTPVTEPAGNVTAGQETKPPLQPAPTPTPAAPVAMPSTVAPTPAPEVAAAKVPPTIDEASVKVLPTEKGYAVQAQIEGAESVQAYLGPDTVAMEQREDGTWAGELLTDEAPVETQFLFVGATAPDGQKTYDPVAAIAPKANSAQLYAGGGDSKKATVFGHQITGLEDGVRRFYFYAALFLFAALAMKVAVKFHIQRHSVIAHSMFVIGLFAILSLG